MLTADPLWRSTAAAFIRSAPDTRSTAACRQGSPQTLRRFLRLPGFPPSSGTSPVTTVCTHDSVSRRGVARRRAQKPGTRPPSIRLFLTKARRARRTRRSHQTSYLCEFGDFCVLFVKLGFLRGLRDLRGSVKNRRGNHPGIGG